MRLTFVLLTAVFLNVSANGLSQNISFSGNNVLLKKIFNEIEKQTGYSVTYTNDVLADAKPISINVQNLPLEEFLEKILNGQSIKYEIEDKIILLSRKTNPSVNKDLKSTEQALISPGSVQGRVINENGEPLIGASITIKGISSQGTSSDINGYYKIENIAAGQCTLVVSFVGYGTKTAAINIAENNTSVINFTLTPSLVNLDETIVTSTLSKRSIRAYPGTIAEIKGKDLQNRNLNNIANVLEGIPGVFIQPGLEMSNSGTSRMPAGLQIRGSSAFLGNPIKYLIDGVEIVSAAGGDILQTMDPNNIDKIEVLKGPMASTLYGSGAAGGVISITTKRGNPGKTQINFKTMFTQYANDYANYSGYNQNYSLNVSGGSEQFNYLIGVGYNFYPTTKLSDTSNGINDKTWSYTAKFRAKTKSIIADISLQYGTEKSGSGSTDASFNKYRESLGLQTFPVATLQDFRNTQRSFLTSLHLTHTITDNWYQDLTAGYSVTNNSNNSYTLDYTGSYNNNELLRSRMNVRYFMFYSHDWNAAFKSSLTAGFEYNRYDAHFINMGTTTALTDFFTSSVPENGSVASMIRAVTSSAGYFTEIVTAYKNNLFLTTGIRYEMNPAYGENVGAYAQPRVGLSYVIEQDKFKIKPRVVWGVSSEAPNPSYRVSHNDISPYANFIYIGNPDIKPQRSEGYEFGADVFYGNNYSLSVTYYDQKIKDMIQQSLITDYTTNPPTYTLYYYNIGRALNKGVEVSSKIALDPITIDLSYTSIVSKWGKDIGQAQIPTQYPGAPISGVPKKSFFVRLNYKVPTLLSWSKKGGGISLEWKYTGNSYDYDYISYSLATDAWNNLPDPKPDYPDINSYYILQKGYFYFNLRANYSVTDYADLYIDVQNLLDKHGSINGQSLAQFPGRRINFGFNVNF